MTAHVLTHAYASKTRPPAPLQTLHQPIMRKKTRRGGDRSSSGAAPAVMPRRRRLDPTAHAARRGRRMAPAARRVERHISADSPVAVTSHVTGLSLAPFRNDNPLLRDATGTVQKRDRTPCATPTSVTSRVGVAELLTSHPLLSHRMTRSPRRSTGRRPAPRPAPRGSPRPWSPWSWSWALRSFCGAP
jgi:hypothetical protein